MIGQTRSLAMFVVLAPRDPCGPVVVELGAFVDFALGIDVDLEEVVERETHGDWLHSAAAEPPIRS